MIGKNGKWLRWIDHAYQEHFDHFISSGLYKQLQQRDAAVSFEEVTDSGFPGAYKVLLPQQIGFISYPYEWCFSQLRDAALLTLAIQKIALSCGMTLKDASAYNIQFRRGKPVHIDTLSFERYTAGPWRAYRQFCQHFLLPLVLMSFKDVHAGKCAAIFSDGLPLEMGANLLGLAWFRRPSLYLHIMLQGRLEGRGAGGIRQGRGQLDKAALLRLVEHLEKLVMSLPAPRQPSHWSHYTAERPYNEKEQELKRQTIAQYHSTLRPETVWDIGANSGEFSRIAISCGAEVIALEAEHALVETLYGQSREGIPLLPLWMDMAAPSGACGWAHEEHRSLVSRGPADLLLCLAVSHHLALSGQIPFARQAAYFSTLATHLAIEFISPDDPQAKKLLNRHPALRPLYTQHAFETGFGLHFDCLQSQPVVPDRRTLYLFKKR